MKTYYECIACFINQTLRMTGEMEDEQRKKIVREALTLLAETDFAVPPPLLSRKVFDIVERYTGIKDSYAEIKRNSNTYIMNMYERLLSMVSGSADPFDTAMRLAIAGNVIDFGANHKFTDETIHADIRRVLTAPDIDSTKLKREVEKAGNILYIGDNAGEIVFDKLFISQMPKHRIIFAVKGKPVLNDALREDAVMVGITDMVRVIDNGTAIPGTALEFCSSEFKEVFEKVDLVISKGQGNYETLSGINKNIFFLLKIKCAVIARDIGCELNSFQAISQGRQ